MVFARPSGSRTSSTEEEEGKRRTDISVFPLAFPFIAGPGSLATILLAFGPASDDPLLFGGLLLCVALALVCALLTLYLATPIMRLMGVTGANVVNRLFGVVLGALAVQYVIDGVRGSLYGGRDGRLHLQPRAQLLQFGPGRALERALCMKLLSSVAATRLRPVCSA